MLRTKPKAQFTREQFNAVDQLVGNTSEGQRLLSLMREGNELTALHNQGLKGGVSRVTTCSISGTGARLRC